MRIAGRARVPGSPYGSTAAVCDGQRKVQDENPISLCNDEFCVLLSDSYALVKLRGRQDTPVSHPVPPLNQPRPPGL